MGESVLLNPLDLHHPWYEQICGLQPGDLDLFRMFAPYQGPGREGFITDFLGVRTSVSFVSGSERFDGEVMGYPVPSCWHASALEHIATLRSVLEAQERLIAVELGAGWGPWLVTAAAAARQRGIANIHLLGVEADANHVEMMRCHLAENGFDVNAEVLLGAVTDCDGTARFPIVDHPSAGWGACVDDANAQRFVEVPSYRIATLLEKFDTVDFMHLDIQGFEKEAIRASLDALNEKVRRLFIGTHSRQSEIELMEMLFDTNWRLENEQPCILRFPEGRKPDLYVDGCQTWYNTHFGKSKTVFELRLDQLVGRIETEGKRLAIYGAGEHTDMLFKTTALRRVHPVALFDRDTAKHGTTCHGATVHPPLAAGTIDFNVILISSKFFREEIKDFLSLHLRPEVEIIDLYEGEEV
jgi:FkbM family methyltransferase